jgi:UDP-glucose 4-epimerase
MQKKHTPLGEGTERERLAAYFLSAPPYEEQTSAQKIAYCQKLTELGRVEIREILNAAGSSRPLVWGNPVPHLQNLLTAAQRLAAGEPVEPAYNLGSGDGLSVKQIMDAVARVTGIDFTPEIGPRRPGDPDRIVATGELAARDLDWQMRYTVDEMVRTGWEARRAAS